MTAAVPVTLTINGETLTRLAEPRETLADFLRRDLGLTGNFFATPAPVAPTDEDAEEDEKVQVEFFVLMGEPKKG